MALIPACLLMAALGAVTTALDIRLAIEPQQISVSALSAGVPLAIFLWWPRRDWLALTASFFAAEAVVIYLSGGPFWLGLWIAFNGIVAAFFASFVYHAIARRVLPLEGRRPVMALIAAAAVNAFLSATLGAAAYQNAFAAFYGLIWLIWAPAVFTGTLFVTPAMLAWLNPREALHAALRSRSAYVFAIAILGVTFIVFLDVLTSQTLRLMGVYVLVPIFVWLAVRRTALEIVTLLIAVSVIGAWATSLGEGPTTQIMGSLADQVIWLQAFLSTTAIATYVVYTASEARRISEKALTEREARLQSILDAVPDALVTVDDDGTIESFGAAASQLFGYGESEVTGTSFAALLSSPYREDYERDLKGHLTPGRNRAVMAQRKDGSVFPTELSIGEAYTRQRHILTVFIHDISKRQLTERRMQELQSELLHVTRLSTMGHIASALAHEINQPLTAIVNYVQAGKHLLTNEDADWRAKTRDVMAKAAAQAERAGGIIRNLRSFLKKREPEITRESANRLVAEANALALAGASDAGVRTVLDLAPGLPDVAVDRLQIQQVVINLVRNAIDAMAASPKRELSIRTRPTADGVEVAVLDSGPGVAPDVEAKLFEPFVTTKADGMGVGLSICRTIVEAHGGRLWHEANPAGGAVFTFTLPAFGADHG